MSIAYYHIPCGNLLIFFCQDTPPQKGQLIKPTDWQYPDGSLLETGPDVKLRCDHCGVEWSFSPQSITPELPKTP